MTEPAAPVLTPVRRAVLTALADTVVPSLPREDDPTGYWATAGSLTGAPEAFGMWLEERATSEVREGLLQLLDAMAAMGLPNHSQRIREVIIKTVANLGPEARVGITALVQNLAMLAYSLPDATGRNPFWAQLGYPGPQTMPDPSTPRPITPYQATDNEVLEADVVVVGSGAGGGTIAGVLASQGKRVVVLEMGGHHDETDFLPLEAWAHENLFYRNGPTMTADSNVVVLAGSTLGGGTTINWQNCVQPSQQVRDEWARHGLTDVADDFDRHLEAVLARISATDECSDLNGPHQRMLAAAEQLGWSAHVASRNTVKESYDPNLAGYTHFGDTTGAKQGTLRTYLQDAFDHGARILVNTRARTVCTADGRATGIEAVQTDPASGATRRVTVLAPDVVVACGAMETPALLLRSGIGGPAVGKHLRLHPAGTFFGLYDDDQRAWWGPPQAAVVDEFAGIDDGYGYLIEGSQYYSGLFAGFLAWNSGAEHKAILSQLARMSPLLFVLRDRGDGNGQVTLGPEGEAVHTYALADPDDQRLYREAAANLMRMHEAAGAQEIHWAVPGVGHWTRGEDLEAFIARFDGLPIGAGGLPMGCAHQMGSARMGSDPATSVADPTGQLHDTPGVWIGDTSAFPTASGANPMVTCMALAHRTAEHIAGQAAGDAAPTQVDLDEVAPAVMS